MSSLALVAFGGVVGAVIGILWSDPYRDQEGRYKTHGRSHGSWLLQGAIGGIIGAIVTPPLFIAMIGNPWVGPIVFFAGTFLIYKRFVDPR